MMFFIGAAVGGYMATWAIGIMGRPRWTGFWARIIGIMILLGAGVMIFLATLVSMLRLHTHLLPASFTLFGYFFSTSVTEELALALANRSAVQMVIGLIIGWLLYHWVTRIQQESKADKSVISGAQTGTPDTNTDATAHPAGEKASQEKSDSATPTVSESKKDDGSDCDKGKS